MSSALGMTGVAQMSKFQLCFVTPALTHGFTADYCASKAAVIGLHESLRYELDKMSVPLKSLVSPSHLR